MATLWSMTRRPARAALASAVLALAVAPAAASGSTAFPMQLPGDASAASVRAAGSTWIVGARPGATATALARRYAARVTGPAGTGGYVVAKDRARAFAGALRRAGILVYAQPDVLRVHKAMPEDPFDTTFTWRKH